LLKFQRNYKLTIELDDGGDAIIITPPFTIRFNVNRSVMSSLNTMDISIYNLAPQTRHRIFQDRFNTVNYKRVIFEGGYGQQLSVLFIGGMYEANSGREGVDVVTRINCFGGFYDVRNTRVYKTIAAGQTQKQILTALVKDFPHVNQNPIIGDVGSTIMPRATTVNGNLWNFISTFSAPIKPFIDNEQVIIMKDSEVRSGLITTLDASTGLLQTPRRDSGYLTLTTLFEPRINMGQQIQLASTIEPIYNGAYKVIGIQHEGIISDAENGDLRSVFQLLTGSKIFKYTEVA
jgi:hypothetical protein